MWTCVFFGDTERFRVICCGRIGVRRGGAVAAASALAADNAAVGATAGDVEELDATVCGRTCRWLARSRGRGCAIGTGGDCGACADVIDESRDGVPHALFASTEASEGLADRVDDDDDDDGANPTTVAGVTPATRATKRGSATMASGNHTNSAKCVHKNVRLHAIEDASPVARECSTTCASENATRRTVDVSVFRNASLGCRSAWHASTYKNNEARDSSARNEATLRT